MSVREHWINVRVNPEEMARIREKQKDCLLYTSELAPEAELSLQGETIPADPNVKNFSYAAVSYTHQELAKQLVNQGKARLIHCYSRKSNRYYDTTVYVAVSYTHLDVYKRQTRHW